VSRALHQLGGEQHRHRAARRIPRSPPNAAPSGVEYSAREVANFDSLSDLDRQQVFGSLKRAGVRLPRLRNHTFGVRSM
jgi:hypothetical protein